MLTFKNAFSYFNIWSLMKRHTHKKSGQYCSWAAEKMQIANSGAEWYYQESGGYLEKQLCLVNTHTQGLFWISVWARGREKLRRRRVRKESGLKLFYISERWLQREKGEKNKLPKAASLIKLIATDSISSIGDLPVNSLGSAFNIYLGHKYLYLHLIYIYILYILSWSKS